MNIPLTEAALCCNCDNIINFAAKKDGTPYCNHCGSLAVMNLVRIIKPLILRPVMITPGKYHGVADLPPLPKTPTNSGTGRGPDSK